MPDEKTSPVNIDEQPPFTFAQEMERDLKKITNASNGSEDLFKNIMLYHARKQTIFLYDIRHYLNELVKLSETGGL